MLCDTALDLSISFANPCDILNVSLWLDAQWTSQNITTAVSGQKNIYTLLGLPCEITFIRATIILIVRYFQ